MFKKILLSILVLVLLILGYFLLSPSPIDPVAWNPPVAPALTGDYAQNDRLSRLERLFVNQCFRCEDVAIDSTGSIYGGQETGEIIRFSQNRRTVLANTGGRPLGLHFDKNGQLIVADTKKGLLSVNPDNGTVTTLVNEYLGEPMKFVDDVEVAADGTIYFSDASQRWGYEDNKWDIIEGRPTGRLFSWHPATGTTTLLLDNLAFANGIAVAHDQSYVLVNETGKYRTTRYWLKGAKVGTSDIFMDNLPGFPDGISQGKNGIYWMALVAPRTALLDQLSNSVFLKKIAAKLPAFLQPSPTHYGFVLGVDKEGKVVYNLQDPAGEFAEITSVQQAGEQLYLGSLYEKEIARFDLEQLQ